uniref:Uncharacterized protein n=1 Tax=Pithovirus LCPAC403 TaxID=2506596 RepID=A0A481ZB26_9VIRU|nr:MAG: hypothetical protein LCPAC403_01210 [Pithovirus LCPAC403]
MPIPAKPWNMSSKGINYIDARKLWKKTKYLYQSEEATDIWLPSLCKKLNLNPHGGWDKMDIEELQQNLINIRHDVEDVDGLLPRHFDSVDWRYFERGSTHPRYWDYVCHGACHFMVELYYWIIIQVLPEHDWQIIHSNSHSTVWNGKDLIYDPAFQALHITAGECFNMAYEDDL